MLIPTCNEICWSWSVIKSLCPCNSSINIETPSSNLDNIILSCSPGESSCFHIRSNIVFKLKCRIIYSLDQQQNSFISTYTFDFSVEVLWTMYASLFRMLSRLPEAMLVSRFSSDWNSSIAANILVLETAWNVQCVAVRMLIGETEENSPNCSTNIRIDYKKINLLTHFSDSWSRKKGEEHCLLIVCNDVSSTLCEDQPFVNAFSSDADELSLWDLPLIDTRENSSDTWYRQMSKNHNLRRQWEGLMVDLRWQYATFPMRSLYILTQTGVFSLFGSCLRRAAGDKVWVSFHALRK